MNRKKIVAGNWKMNGSRSENAPLIEGIQSADGVTVIVAPPFVYLSEVWDALSGTPGVELAAQNCHAEASGAYTGEVSPQMLKDVGCTWVILGHSERREYQQENSDLLLAKTKAALAAGLKVIFCCGEPLEIRDADQQNDHIAQQLRETVLTLPEADWNQLVIAYEPIWAIGTGRTATAEQAQDMHAHIRKTIADALGTTVADQVRILYGGSAKPSNAPELFAQPDVDGGLIGGAALKAADFNGIIEAAKTTSK
ncbi:MAG: triose-phosphate isomerase [Sphingobacteriales bacterium]|nr:MAG: triose-phosphate isomerase [Sphingobacteriales bacterium]